MFHQKQTAFKFFALATAGVFVLSGCRAGREVQHPPRSADASTSTGPTLTDADAGRLYEEYMRTNDLILAEGGTSPERMEQFAAADALDDFARDAKDFQHRGWRLTGSTHFDSMAIQDSSASSISFYVCDDVSETDLFDQSGRSLVEPDRVTRSPWTIDSSMSAGGTLKIDSKELWTGEDFCQ